MAGRVVVNGGKPTYDFESVTVGAAAVGLTSTLFHKQSATAPTKDAQYALISVEADAIRYRTDGTDPTAAVGHKLAIDDVLILDNFDDIRRFKAIRVTLDATIRVSYS